MEGYKQFSTVVGEVNKWRLKRSNFIKAASALSTSGSELTMRGAVFAVINGLYEQVNSAGTSLISLKNFAVLRLALPRNRRMNTISQW